MFLLELFDVQVNEKNFSSNRTTFFFVVNNLLLLNDYGEFLCNEYGIGRLSDVYENLVLDDMTKSLTVLNEINDIDEELLTLATPLGHLMEQL